MNLHRSTILAGAVLLASAVASIALAAPKATRKPGPGLPRYGMVVFSDLCLTADGGEYGGQRITLQRFNEVDTVLYEYTAGGLSWPVVASDVTIDPRGRQFYFTVQPPEEDERTISGKLSEDGQTLVLDGGYCEDESVPMRLHRVTDFGRKAGTCPACPAPKHKKPPAEMEDAEPQQESAPPAPATPLRDGAAPIST